MNSGEKDIESFLNVPSSTHRHFLGWIFILVALVALLAIGFRQSDLYTGTAGLELTTYFKQGHSLRPGSKVLIASVQVGEVRDVVLMYDPSADTDRIRVQVRMLIKGEYAHSIPENTVAEIRFGALEFANAIVLIPPDVPTVGRLVDGAVIPALPSIDMIEEAKSAFAEVSRDLQAVVTNLKTLSSDVADTDGSYNRIVGSLLVSSNNVERITTRSRAAFESRQSMAGLMLNDNSGAVRNINNSLNVAGRTAVKIETFTDSMTAQMDTFTAIAGQMRTATARLPRLIGHADSTLAIIDRTATRVGNSWLFGSSPMTNNPRDRR